jgi:hypothetical protein
MGQGASPATRFEELRTKIKPDQRLVVTTSDGTKVRGRFEGTERSPLRLRTGDGLREFEPNGVREVRLRSDRLWNGALIGLGIGAGVGAIAGASAHCSDEAVFCAGIGMLAAMPAGLGLGLIVDALTPHDHVLYEQPRQSRRFSVEPFWTRSAYGGRVAFGF